ncbi:MAG: hypothetical protein ACI97A_003436 [Planctomycetota bacterium]|jgi:hypothetical protein
MRHSHHVNSLRWAYRPWLGTMCLFLAIGATSGCNQDTKELADPEVSTTELSPADREFRENRAAFLLKKAQPQDPVNKIDLLVDVAHVYHDTAAGPKAWQELIFYLVDHSNDDFTRAETELNHFSRRCPDSLELLASCMLYTNACIKSLMPPSKVADSKKREGQRDRSLELWIKVGEYQCGIPANADHYGAHLETGNGYTYSRKFEDAERIWAKVEEFKVPATDIERVKLLVKRADLIRSQGGDLKKAKSLFILVREFQDRMVKETSEQMRTYVDEALKSLKDS